MSDVAWSWLQTTFTVTWLVLGAFAAGHAVMYKRDPRSAVIWIFMCFTFPIMGPWLYWVFGINRIERRAVRRRAQSRRTIPPQDLAARTREAESDARAVGPLMALRRAADRVTKLPLVSGNLIEPLYNGEESYPAMLSAIALAKRSITLESYIFDYDEVGREFAAALNDAARRGVKVHVIADGIGALGHFSRMGRLLRRSGAQIATFFPLRFPLGRVRLNMRNHRKLLIVDGMVGFTGGINISARHNTNRSAPDRTDDLHFRVTGPVVEEMQDTFCDDWHLVSGELLSGDDYFPPLDSAGASLARAVVSGPDEDLEKIHLVILAALAAAQHSIRIVTPYFIPTPALVTAISMAALRGVNVTIQLPSKVDLPFMRWAADAYLWQFLEHGVRVLRRPPPFVHTKLLIVDERWVMLGSANLDRRSFRLNFEFNLEVYDTEFAAALAARVDADGSEAERVTLESVDARPGWQRFRDGFVRLFSPHL